MDPRSGATALRLPLVPEGIHSVVAKLSDGTKTIETRFKVRRQGLPVSHDRELHLTAFDILPEARVVDQAPTKGMQRELLVRKKHLFRECVAQSYSEANGMAPWLEVPADPCGRRLLRWQSRLWIAPVIQVGSVGLVSGSDGEEKQQVDVEHRGKSTRRTELTLTLGDTHERTYDREHSEDDELVEIVLGRSGLQRRDHADRKRERHGYGEQSRRARSRSAHQPGNDSERCRYDGSEPVVKRAIREQNAHLQHADSIVDSVDDIRPYC